MTFGERIKRRRLLLGYSQDYCSVMTGVDRMTWCNWETEKTQPMKVYKQLALDFLGI